MAYSSRVARLCRRASVLGALLLGTCAAAPDQWADHLAEIDGIRLDAAWVFERKTQLPDEHPADHMAARLDGMRLDGAWTEERMVLLPASTLIEIGEYYARGRHVRRDEELAEKLFSAAAFAGGGHFWFFAVGSTYQNRVKNEGKAIAWYEKSVAAGGHLVLSTLARIYKNKKSEFYNPLRAIALYEEAVAAGSSFAHAQLGQFYLEGNGVAVDHARARRHFLEAGECGNAERSLGEIYLKGLGVEKDPAKAERYFLRAARKGWSRDINRLADLYLGKAFPVRKHAVKAFAWYLVDAMLNPGAIESEAWHIYHYLSDRSMEESLSLADWIIEESGPEIFQYSYWDYYRKKRKEITKPIIGGCFASSFPLTYP